MAISNKDFVKKVLGVPFVTAVPAVEAVAEVIDELTGEVLIAAVEAKAGIPEQKATGLEAAFRTISQKNISPSQKAYELRAVYQDRFGKFLPYPELDKLMRQSNWSTIVGHMIQADKARPARKTNDVVTTHSGLMNQISAAFAPKKVVAIEIPEQKVEETC